MHCIVQPERRKGADKASYSHQSEHAAAEYSAHQVFLRPGEAGAGRQRAASAGSLCGQPERSGRFQPQGLFGD